VASRASPWHTGAVATYPGALGVNAQIRYVGKNGTHAAGETWQTGLRIGWSEAVGPFDTSEGRVTLAEKTVADAFVTRSTANFAVAQGWAGTGVIRVPTDADQDAIAEAFYTWAVAIKAQLSNLYELGDVRLYPFTEDGTSATAPSIYTPTATTADPSGTSAMPLDTAYAMSLGTAVRGPSGRGRMFLGGLSSTVLDPGGYPKTTSMTALRTPTAALVTALRRGAEPGVPYTPVLHTRGTDTGSVIRVVRTNNLFETQRRRDRQVPPQWTETTI